MRTIEIIKQVGIALIAFLVLVFLAPHFENDELYFAGAVVASVIFLIVRVVIIYKAAESSRKAQKEIAEKQKADTAKRVQEANQHFERLKNLENFNEYWQSF